MIPVIRRAPLSDSATRQEYEKAWLDQAPASPFLDPSYLSALDRHTPLRGHVYSGPALIVCVFKKRVGPFHIVVQPPHTPFCAWLGRQGGNPDQTQSLIDNIGKDCSEATLLLPIGNTVDPDTLPDRWHSSDRYTYEIDVQNYSDDLQSENVRRIWKKSKDDYEISSDSDRLDDVLDLVNDSLIRKGIGFPHRGIVSRISNDLVDLKNATVYSGHSAGGIEAGIVLLHTESTAAYWLAGSVPGPAMTILIIKMLAELKGKGLQRFDFVGANTPSVAEFKRRFGATKVQYQMLRRSPSSAFATLKKIRRTLL